MAKLSLATGAAALVLASTSAPPAPAAPPGAADEALARQQSSLRSSLGLECNRDSGEIVVCGRTGPDPDRLPLPVPPEPGARRPGEPADPRAALALSNQKCTTVGRNQQCSGGLPILPIAVWLVQSGVKAVRAVKDKE